MLPNAFVLGLCLPRFADDTTRRTANVPGAAAKTAHNTSICAQNTYCRDNALTWRIVVVRHFSWVLSVLAERCRQAGHVRTITHVITSSVAQASTSFAVSVGQPSYTIWRSACILSGANCIYLLRLTCFRSPKAHHLYHAEAALMSPALSNITHEEMARDEVSRSEGNQHAMPCLVVGSPNLSYLWHTYVCVVLTCVRVRDGSSR